MPDRLDGESLWALHFERRRQQMGVRNRVELIVAAPDLGTAISHAIDVCGPEYRCMTGRHLGHRVVLIAPHATPLATNGQEVDRG